MCPLGGRLVDGGDGFLRKGRIVDHCLLVEAGGELVLVDTGFGTAECAKLRRLPPPFLVINPQLREEETAIRQVEAMGLDPSDVRHIVTTHLDADHAGGLGDFPDAEVHIFGSELKAAQAPPLRDRIRYLKAQWAHGPKWVEYGTGGDSWFGFESVRVIPELDAEIALIPLPGHTAGHCGVAINTGAGWLLHCGDAFFHHRDLDGSGHSPPAIGIYQELGQHSRSERLSNLGRLRELARDHGDEVTLICSHDAKMLDSMSG